MYKNFETECMDFYTWSVILRFWTSWPPIQLFPLLHVMMSVTCRSDIIHDSYMNVYCCGTKRTIMAWLEQVFHLIVTPMITLIHKKIKIISTLYNGCSTKCRGI